MIKNLLKIIIIAILIKNLLHNIVKMIIFAINNITTTTKVVNKMFKCK